MNILSEQDIIAASKFWLEVIPYTSQVVVSPQAQSSLFSVTNINRTSPPKTGLFLTGFASSQLDYMRVDLNYDKNTEYGFMSAAPSNLITKPTFKFATSTMGAKITNTDSTKTINALVNYFATIWQMPIVYKAMQGIGLTTVEQQIAREAGVPITSNNQIGTTPIPFDDIIRRTYKNRRIDELVEWLHPTATSTEQTIYYNQVNSDELLVLANIATEANLDDGISIIVDRDDDPNHINISAANCNLDGGFDIICPAISSINVKIQANNTLTYETPVRLTLWKLNLSSILAFRLGVLGARDATTPQLEKLFYDIIGGVR